MGRPVSADGRCPYVATNAEKIYFRPREDGWSCGLADDGGKHGHILFTADGEGILPYSGPWHIPEGTPEPEAPKDRLFAVIKGPIAKGTPWNLIDYEIASPTDVTEKDGNLIIIPSTKPHEGATNISKIEHVCIAKGQWASVAIKRVTPKEQ